MSQEIEPTQASSASNIPPAIDAQTSIDAPPIADAQTTTWVKVAEAADLPEGRVMTVTAGHRSLALCHFEGSFGALDNHCPHQGGPLGEGSIEKGWLRCPWHGYDYHPVERGVGHLILPDEVQVLPAPDTAAGSPQGRLPSLRVSPSPEVVDQAASKLKEAKRPLFIVGAGARHDLAAIIALAEQLGAPVATTFKAKGQISDHHPLGCGVLGRSGTPVASWFMNESDLLVVFGASFSNHTGIAPYKPIIQVDFDPMALGRFHNVDVPVLGDVGVVAEILSREVAAANYDQRNESMRAEVAERWEIWRTEKASRRQDDTGHGVNSASVFDSLTRLVAPDAVVCVDVGNNTYSFGRYFEVDRHSVLMSGYLGSIGFGLPAALGAWAADTGRQVVSISGDGGFGQYAMELTTAVKYNMDITHFLLNNHELGKISKEQRAGLFDVWQTSLRNPSFADFAELCGARGFSVTDRASLDAAVAEALAHRGPALVEIESDVSLV